MRSKNGFVTGLQGNKAVSLGVGSDANNISTTTSGLTDAVFLTALVAGNATVTPSGGGSDVVIYLTAGGTHPLQVSHVKATGTAATGIVGIWS
jgi:hypothetical protein